MIQGISISEALNTFVPTRYITPKAKWPKKPPTLATPSEPKNDTQTTLEKS